jgi:hypothetical protein
MQDEMNDLQQPYTDLAPGDLVRVVRCKDCKNYNLSKNGVNGQCGRQYATFYAYDYCSYGERKDG